MGRLNIKELKDEKKTSWSSKIYSNVFSERLQKVTNSCGNVLYAAAGWAQHGFSFLGSAAWVLSTGLIVLYLPLLRALDSDRESIRMLRVSLQLWINFMSLFS